MYSLGKAMKLKSLQRPVHSRVISVTWIVTSTVIIRWIRCQQLLCITVWLTIAVVTTSNNKLFMSLSFRKFFANISRHFRPCMFENSLQLQLTVLCEGHREDIVAAALNFSWGSHRADSTFDWMRELAWIILYGTTVAQLVERVVWVFALQSLAPLCAKCPWVEDWT